MDNIDTSSSDFISSFINDISENLNINNNSISDFKLIYKSNSGWNQLYKCSIHGKLHVVKSLQKQYHGTDIYEAALNKEFNIGFHLEHPNICRTINWLPLQRFGNAILMEYIDGITLEEFINQKRLTADFAYKFISEICDALQYLHSKQIVHRDIKPSNILITHNGHNVKLIDFSLSDCDSYNILKSPAGTKHYIAPEAMQPNTPLDVRTDIYSFGIVMQEMAAAIENKQAAKHILSIAGLSTAQDINKRICSVSQIKTLLHSNTGRIKGKRNGRAANTWQIAITTIAAVAAGFILYHSLDRGAPHVKHTLNDTTLINSISFGNYSYNKECRELLQTINHKTDTVQIFSKLKYALDKDFPLTIQQQSKHYQRLFENLKQQARTIHSTSAITPN